METWHWCFRHPGDKFQVWLNLDLSKALNNGYRPLLLRIEGYPGHFKLLLIKIHLLAFEFVTENWIIIPKLQKNLFSWCLHLNLAWNSSDGPPLSLLKPFHALWFTCMWYSSMSMYQTCLGILYKCTKEHGKPYVSICNGTLFFETPCSTVAYTQGLHYTLVLHHEHNDHVKHHEHNDHDETCEHFIHNEQSGSTFNRSKLGVHHLPRSVHTGEVT